MMNEKESKAFLNDPSWRPAEAETVDLWTACLLVAKSGVHSTYHNAGIIFEEAQVEINDGRDKRDKLSKAGFLVGKQDKDFPWMGDDFCKNPPKVNLRAFMLWAKGAGKAVWKLEEAMETPTNVHWITQTDVLKRLSKEVTRPLGVREPRDAALRQQVLYAERNRILRTNGKSGRAKRYDNATVDSLILSYQQKYDSNDDRLTRETIREAFSPTRR